jgi:hypothetical protein
MEMTSSESVTCAACRHEIDAAAKLCPYCGADPRTGEKIDTQALLESEFKPRQLSATENVMEYARQRQGIVLALGITAALLVLLGLHAFVTNRNETQVSAANAVPLAEVAEIGTQEEAPANTPMPELQFQYDGHPQTLRTFIVEPGAVTPPEVIAAQQAAAQAAAQQKAAALAAAQAKAGHAAPGPPSPPGAAAVAQPRPAVPLQPVRPAPQPPVKH